MSPQRRTFVLLVVGGLLLVTNPLWLLPHEGETEYTYERSEILVENGTLTYDGAGVLGFSEENSLNPVGCQRYDDEQPRACAFDHHLVSHEPVTVPGRPWGVLDPEFVRLDDGYYRRIHRITGSGENRTGTHDVERVTPETVLAESAVNLSGGSGAGSDDLPLAVQIAVTGETRTSFEDLDEDQLGTVYRYDGSYYTVVGTDDRSVDRGLTYLRYELPRYLLASVGVLLLVGALFVYSRGEPG